MAQRTLFQNLVLSLKGMAMGAADVVPGVSGGTIAFISGIYEELINSLSNINLKALKVWRQEGIAAFWKHINGTFFVFLFGGIGISIVALSKIVTKLLDSHPIILWSFFFGLIIASIWMVGKSVKKWTVPTIVSMVIGIGVALWISMIQTTASMDAEWFVILSGAIAICAMILPGISGSFILVLMGSYHVIYGAIAEMNLTIVGLFAIGCVIGLLSFARVLKYLFANFHDVTVTLLTGFMIGALYKVWPWKKQIGDAPLVIHSDGKEDWMMANVSPAGYEKFVGDNAQLGLAIACAVGGFLLIFILERFAPKEK